MYKKLKQSPSRNHARYFSLLLCFALIPGSGDRWGSEVLLANFYPLFSFCLPWVNTEHTAGAEQVRGKFGFMSWWSRNFPGYCWTSLEGVSFHVESRWVRLGYRGGLGESLSSSTDILYKHKKLTLSDTNSYLLTPFMTWVCIWDISAKY